MGHGELWLSPLPAAGWEEWDALGFVWNKVEMFCRGAGWDVGCGQLSLSAWLVMEAGCLPSECGCGSTVGYGGEAQLSPILDELTSHVFMPKRCR